MLQHNKKKNHKNEGTLETTPSDMLQLHETTTNCKAIHIMTSISPQIQHEYDTNAVDDPIFTDNVNSRPLSGLLSKRTEHAQATKLYSQSAGSP